MDIGQIGVYLAQVVALGTFVWGVMKGVTWKINQDMPAGPSRKRKKRIISWLIGPATGIVAYGLGLLYVSVELKHWIWGWIGAAFFGAAGTAVAWGTHALTKPKKPASRLPQ